jgi:hypothetical protein
MSTQLIGANVKHNKGDRQSRNERHTFVLVHGGWCGGWIWRYVAPALRERHDLHLREWQTRFSQPANGVSPRTDYDAPENDDAGAFVPIR